MMEQPKENEQMLKISDWSRITMMIQHLEMLVLLEWCCIFVAHSTWHHLHGQLLYLQHVQSKRFSWNSTETNWMIFFKIDAYPYADFASMYSHETVTDPVCVKSKAIFVITVALAQSYGSQNCILKLIFWQWKLKSLIWSIVAKIWSLLWIWLLLLQKSLENSMSMHASTHEDNVEHLLWEDNTSWVDSQEQTLHDQDYLVSGRFWRKVSNCWRSKCFNSWEMCSLKCFQEFNLKTFKNDWCDGKWHKASSKRKYWECSRRILYVISCWYFCILSLSLLVSVNCIQKMLPLF